MFAKGAYSGFAPSAGAGFAITNLTTVFRSDMDLADMVSVEDGWMLSVKADGTTNVYSAVVRGNYHVALTAAGGADTNAVVTVSDAWVAANVPSAQTVQDVEAKLEEVDPALGMKRWQAYVLNRESALAVTAVSNDGKVTIALEEPRDVGLAVTYSLDRVSKTGADVLAGTESANRTDVGSINFAALAEGEYGLYKVRVHFTTPEGTSIAEATNTVGVLRASSAAQLSVVSVPWGSLEDGGDVKVSDYLRGAGISEGDMLFSYNASQDVYDAWKYESGSWVSQTTYKVDFEGGMGSTDSPLPTVKGLERGSGVWLKRGESAGSGPVCLVGLYVTNRVHTSLVGGYNLVAPPTAEAVSLNALFPNPGDGDAVMVPTDGAPKTYTFKDGSWGYSSAETQKITFAGRTLTVSVPVRVTDDTVPAGKGFWYVNGGSTNSIEW